MRKSKQFLEKKGGGSEPSMPSKPTKKEKKHGKKNKKETDTVDEPPKKKHKKDKKDKKWSSFSSLMFKWSGIFWKQLIVADLCRGPLVMIHNVKIWSTKHQQHTVHLSASLFEAALSFGPAVGTLVGGLNSSVNFCCWAMAIEWNYISWEMGQFCKEHDRVQETGKMLAAFAHPNVKANLDSILVLSTSLEIPNPVSQHMLPTHSNDLVPGAGPGLRCLIKEVSNGVETSAWHKWFGMAGRHCGLYLV